MKSFSILRARSAILSPNVIRVASFGTGPLCSSQPKHHDRQQHLAKLGLVAGAGSVAFGSSISKCEEPTRSEVLIGQVSDFEDGGMKAVTVGEGKKVLIMRRGKDWYATGAKCSHYNYDLVKGVSSKLEVTCPLHDASFDIRSGHPMKGPGLDAIPTYPVTIKDSDQVYISIPQEWVTRVPVPMAKRDPNNKTCFVIVGGGAAGMAAAESMRQSGFTGRIVMVSDEETGPYDRILLSKKPRTNTIKGVVKSSDIGLRPDSFFDDYGIELILNHTVTKIDPHTKELIITSNSSSPSINPSNEPIILSADKVLLATGSSAKSPISSIPGADLNHVYTLRNIKDAEKFSQAIKSKSKPLNSNAVSDGPRVVVIGSGFVGMEAAALARSLGCQVTVVGSGTVPFERVFGKRVGAYFAQLLKENGVTFKGNSKVKLLRSRNNMSVGGDTSAASVFGSEDVLTKITNKTTHMIDTAKSWINTQINSDTPTDTQSIVDGTDSTDAPIDGSPTQDSKTTTTTSSSSSRKPRTDVAAVELEDGDMIQADVVLVAIGAVPNTSFATSTSSIPLDWDGGILVDPTLKVRGGSNDWLYAAGDIATFPSVYNGQDTRIEHWCTATDQGRIAGKNMATQGFNVYTEVPFFWTMMFGKGLRWVGQTSSANKSITQVMGDNGNVRGSGSAWDNVIIEGDLPGGKFCAFYIANNKVAAVATVGMDPLAVAASAAIKRNLMPSGSEFLLGTANSQTIIDRVTNQ